ncbi:hypothetical protein GGR51DRAFT_517180 [Nemania sp. FL0031]|nr:hypothetical protein GGR51DRAFT_517180 [Nemania sp. FL0031]
MLGGACWGLCAIPFLFRLVSESLRQYAYLHDLTGRRTREEKKKSTGLCTFTFPANLPINTYGFPSISASI